jgi:NAD(P)-dependent dehydrogenase (short-subunit alcohol dehydrogenase family)
MELVGKVAIITGAGSGIGRATAILFAKEGAKVAVVDINEEGGEETVRKIKEAGGDSIFIKASVSDSVDVQKMVKETVKKYGRLDILYNNAGVPPVVREGIPVDSVTELEEEEWDKVMAVNLKGIFLGSKYAIPEMLKSGGGVIINTASAWGFLAAPKSTAYCTSKAGVIMLTKAMAIDYAPKIRVNCICPGEVETPMHYYTLHSYKDPERARKKMLEQYPLGRIGKPEEVAQAALYLASDRSSFVTGTALIIDGGWLAFKPGWE